MAEIIDHEELDRDTVDLDVLDQQFGKKYTLLTEKAVSLDKSYINSLHVNKASKIALGLSDSSIEVYQLDNTSLNSICKLSGHKKVLTEVVTSPKDENLVLSCGEDGLVKLWDTRQGGTCALEYKDEEEEMVRPFQCMDVSCNGLVLCAGSQVVEDDAYLVFWDQRLPKPLGGYWNSHTDEVTQVKFHKEKIEILATGSLDGLVNIFNIMEQTEDDALTYSLNTENSIGRLSWLDGKQLACLTDSNDLQVWDADSGDLIREYERDKVARNIKRSREDDCYLVDAYTANDGTHVLLAGSYGGNENILRSVTMADKRLFPCTNFTQNKQIVRCCWYDKQRDILITTGESGIISVWNGVHEEDENDPGPHKLMKNLDRLHVNRHKPY